MRTGCFRQAGGPYQIRPPLEVHRQVVRQSAVLSAALDRRSVRVDVDSCSDRLLIASDDVQTLLFNIFDNCAKYCRPGSTVRVAFSNQGEMYRVSFAMDSLVIAESEIDEIFRYGIRGERAESYTRQGQGLGLLLARRIARGYGGDIRVFPKPSKRIGDSFSRNRFVIFFPNRMLVR